MKIDDAIKVLKDNGHKYTDKRKDLITLLHDSSKYLNAKQIQTFLNDKYPGISFDTIYRNLHLFESLKLIETTELDGEKNSDLHVQIITIIILFVNHVGIHGSLNIVQLILSRMNYLKYKLKAIKLNYMDCAKSANKKMPRHLFYLSLKCFCIMLFVSIHE